MMKSAVKYICVAMIALAGSGTAARGDWEFIDSGVTETLNDVYFTDELHGWAVGDSSTIITTTDGGETWIKQECPVSGLKLMKVVFKGETGICYCGLSTTWLMSHDSGKTWEIPDTDFTTMRYRGTFFMLNDQTIWITGYDKTDSTQGLYYTNNGGMDWERRHVYSHIIAAMFFKDEYIGWALHGTYGDNFSSTDVLYTENGGKTWDRIHTMYATPTLLQYFPPDVLWAGWPQLFRSENSGRDWTNISSSSDYRSISYRFPISDTQIYARGTNDFSGIWDLLLIDTDENSYTKLLQLPNEKTDFRYVISMFATNEHTLWMVGEGGKIIKYTKDSTVQADHEHIPNEMMLHQNHPNPFNPSTTISFSLQRQDAVELSVYDAVGQKIAAIVNDTLPPGRYSYCWNADMGNQTVSSGLYFAVLTTSAGTVTNKMLLLR